MRKSAITDHLLTADHQLALQVPVQVQNQQMCSALSLSKQEKGMTQVARAAHFIVEQDISLRKFRPVLELLKESSAPDLD